MQEIHPFRCVQSFWEAPAFQGFPPTEKIHTQRPLGASQRFSLKILSTGAHLHLHPMTEYFFAELLQAFHKTHCVPLIPHRFLYSHPHNFQKPVICDWCLSVIVSEAFHKNSAPNPSQLQDPKVSHILANGHSIFLRFYDNHTLLEAPEKSLPDPPSSMQRTAHPKARRISWYFHSVPLLSCVF